MPVGDVTRILLVEDNPEDVRNVERLLAEAVPPFDLTVVGRLSDALPRLAGADVVLLDLGLPDTDPAQTFNLVHAKARGIPIIILTGQNDDQTAARAVGSGAHDLLVKPHIDAPLLIRSVLYAMERQRYQDALRDSEERCALVEDRLRRDALSDALTGLPNWTLFKDRLRAAIAQGKRQSAYRFAVLFLDLDRFKTINDSLGHSNGDQLLVAISKRVADVLRPGDAFARLGGDEFAALIDACGEPSHARRVAERIHAAFEAPLRLDGHEVFVSTSIGIAMSSPRYESPDECLRDADTAMYRAKSSGRGGHAIFDRQMHQRAVEQLTLENDLRRAVAGREFHVYYQPIVSLDDGSVEGFEALVRWEHPERGLLMPDTFIPMAEESGLIIPLDWLVFEEACRQVAVWQQAAGRTPFVSVNFSGRQFRRADLVRHVERVLRETGCRAENLRLELTETVIMENAEAGVEKLASLSNLDLQLYIDDFGTGYSSLSYLQRLPTHAIKIDRSFVSEVAGKSEIVGTIIALARSLNMRVEAEGIENDDQLVRLRQLGCQSGQGYYFSKAVTPMVATGLVRTQIGESIGPARC